MVAECVLGKPCTKMPLPYPDLLIRLRAIIPSSPANVIPAPSQMFSMTRPWLDQTSSLLVTESPRWWPCSGHRPLNIVPFDRPVLTAESDDCPLPAFDDCAICHSPVVALATDSPKAGRSIVPHVKRKIFDTPIVSLAWQKMISWHPGNFQDGGSPAPTR